MELLVSFRNPETLKCRFYRQSEVQHVVLRVLNNTADVPVMNFLSKIHAGNMGKNTFWRGVFLNETENGSSP